MKIIFGQPIDLKVTRITIAKDEENPLNMVLHKCSTCGETLGQHTGYIYREIPGGSPISLFDTPVYIVQCRVCKKRYLIDIV